MKLAIIDLYGDGANLLVVEDTSNLNRVLDDYERFDRDYDHELVNNPTPYLSCREFLLSRGVTVYDLIRHINLGP